MAVLFNSDYFHQTQEVNFKDRYEGRRINITYLFKQELLRSCLNLKIIKINEFIFNYNSIFKY